MEAGLPRSRGSSGGGSDGHRGGGAHRVPVERLPDGLHAHPVQGPVAPDDLVIGIGRCEELTVFFMDALRSVGIPCRQAYTPWWLTVDSNHAWPEVWTPEGGSAWRW